MITWCNEESVGETTLTKSDQTKPEKSLSHMLSTCIKWYLNCCASSSVSSTNSPCHGQLTTGSRATRRKHHGQNDKTAVDVLLFEICILLLLHACPVAESQIQLLTNPNVRAPLLHHLLFGPPLRSLKRSKEEIKRQEMIHHSRTISVLHHTPPVPAFFSVVRVHDSICLLST